jgi:hypothetical protein
MDSDGLDALLCRQLGEGHEMAVIGVDATRADEADDVETTARPRGAGTSGKKGGSLEKAAVGDRGIDPGQVLEDRAAGAKVQVTDLRIAHLTGRQADGILGCAQGRMRPAL